MSDKKKSKDELSEAKRYLAPGAVAGLGAGFGLKKSILKGGAIGALLGGALGYYKGSKNSKDRHFKKSASDMGAKIARLINGVSDE